MQRNRRIRIRVAAVAGITLLACTFVHSMHLHLFHADHATAANHGHEGAIHLCSFTCDEQHLNEAHIVDVDGSWIYDPNIKYKLPLVAAPLNVVLIDLVPGRLVSSSRECVNVPACSDHVTPHRRAPPLA